MSITNTKEREEIQKKMDELIATIRKNNYDLKKIEIKFKSSKGKERDKIIQNMKSTINTSQMLRSKIVELMDRYPKLLVDTRTNLQELSTKSKS